MDLFSSILCVLIASICILSANWAITYFGLSSFSQLIYHVKVPLSGTNIEVIYDWLKMCFLPSLIATISVTVLLSVFVLDYLLVLSFIILIVSLFFALNIIGFPTYIRNQLRRTDIYEKWYVNPENAEITFNEKRNLIHIYLESMENTFSSKECGGESENNLIPELCKIAKDNINFSNNTSEVGGALPVISTGWTTAGLVGSTSGVPINMSFTAPKYKSNQNFMNGIQSLGDILYREGYNQMFLCGSDANFGGRSYYYEKHGGFKIYDLYCARKDGTIVENYKKFWGFEDQKLFAIAKREVEELADKKEPFNLTILTVDTHHPNGYICEICGEEHKQDMENILSCQSKQVNEFLEWIKQQSFYKNTTVIICGDHLSMAAKFIQNTYGKHTNRTIFNAFINTDKKVESNKNRQFCIFDFYPTILSSLGADIKENRLGLGTNLFSSKKTIIEEMGYNKFNSELAKKSNYYNSKIL